jgi:DNA-binding transcriptional LysR family regulator
MRRHPTTSVQRVDDTTDEAPPMRSLVGVWHLLPAFRSVAETESVRAASRLIGSSAPALSRAIGQLEKRVGMKLFHRERQRLVLNERGRALLDAVRVAMQLVDGALHVAPSHRAVRVHAPTHLAALVTDGSKRVAARGEPLTALRTGRVDVVLSHGERAEDLEDDLLCTVLGALTVVGAREPARVEVHATRRRPLSAGDDVDRFVRRVAEQLT